MMTHAACIEKFATTVLTIEESLQCVLFINPHCFYIAFPLCVPGTPRPTRLTLHRPWTTIRSSSSSRMQTNLRLPCACSFLLSSFVLFLSLCILFLRNLVIHVCADFFLPFQFCFRSFLRNLVIHVRADSFLPPFQLCFRSFL